MFHVFALFDPTQTVRCCTVVALKNVEYIFLKSPFYPCGHCQICTTVHLLGCCPAEMKGLLDWCLAETKSSSVGSKFVSVNLNKSYGQPRSSSSSSANAARICPANPGGGGGGMVVLSRARSSVSGGAKNSPKVSIPPPLNLPSLRKEHERLDLSASGGSSSSGNAGSGPGISSSTMGRTKPGISTMLQEKDVGRDPLVFARPSSGGQRLSSPNDGENRGGSSVYMPPNIRLGLAMQQSVSAAVRDVVPVDKAVVLRGEDFPSLHATLSSGTMYFPKQKDGSHQKQRQRPSDEALDEKRESSNSHSPLQMRPQLGSSCLIINSSVENKGIERHWDLWRSHWMDLLRKEIFLGRWMEIGKMVNEW